MVLPGKHKVKRELWGSVSLATDGSLGSGVTWGGGGGGGTVQSPVSLKTGRQDLLRWTAVCAVCVK